MSDERTAGVLDHKLGERVRARRQEIGVSQERLAELLGVTFQQVQKYERGINRIAASRLFDIAIALELPVARFYEGLDNGRRGAKGRPPEDDFNADPGTAELVRLYTSIDSVRVRRRVLDFVRNTAAEND